MSANSIQKTQVAIVDDNHFLIQSIQEKLSHFEDIHLKFTALSGAELLTNLEAFPHLDLVLMDIEMPVLNGIDTTAQIKQKYPHIKVVMLTVFDHDDTIFKAIQAGADGYLLKEISPETLYNGIKQTLEGGAAMTPSIALKTLKLLRNPNVVENSTESITLSSREIEVLEQLAAGLPYTVIAQHLFLSPSTIRKHIENIYKKLQVHNKLEAVQKAKKHNLIWFLLQRKNHFL